MRLVGVSVPEVVREIITRNRSIYDCIKMDLINYTALAVKIQPDVEKLLGGPANLNTIVVAIKRYADSFEEKEPVKIVVDGKIVNIDAEHGDKKYHVKVPIEQKVDENSVKASYKNGILEIIFKQLAEEKPKGKTVEVE